MSDTPNPETDSDLEVSTFEAALENDAFEGTLSAPAETPRRGVGLPTVLIASLLAAFLGAAGGGAVAWHLSEPAADIAPIQAQLDSLKAERAALKNRIATVEQRPVPKSVRAPDLSGIEARLGALETAPAPSIPEVSIPEIDAETLAALKAAQAAGFDYPDISALEAEIVSLREAIATLEARPTTLDLTTADPVIVTAEYPAEPATLAPPVAFPKAELLTAAEDLRLEQTDGFFKRALARNVRVKDGSDPVSQAERLVELVETDRLDLAIEQYQTLPDPLKDIASAWYKSVTPQKEETRP